jgi:hypothetical protein
MLTMRYSFEHDVCVCIDICDVDETQHGV